MYLPYANLVNFTTQPTLGTMSESKLTLSVYNWVGEAQEIIDSSYWFTVTYIYSQFGLAIDATILVQKFTNGVWETLGTFSPNGEKLSTVIQTTVVCVPCAPSDIISQPIHYYVPNYYIPGYYV